MKYGQQLEPPAIGQPADQASLAKQRSDAQNRGLWEFVSRCNRGNAMAAIINSLKYDTGLEAHAAAKSVLA